MLAIRAVMRMGWEVPNPISADQPDNSVRFPFAVILPSTAPTTYDVTFTVTDNESSPNNIEGATVMLNGAEKKTNSSGKAVFKVFGNSTYTYAVTAPGKQSQGGKVEVKTAAAPVTVKLLGE